MHEVTVVRNSEKDLTEGDTMTNFQVRHLDASSMASTGASAAWNSNKMKNSLSGKYRATCH